MVNVWDYANALPRIRLKDSEGKTYVGKVIYVADALETESEQDSIDIELRSGEIKAFWQDEIESIEVLE